MERVNVLDWIRNPGLMIAWLQAKMRAFYMLPARISALGVRAERIKNLIETRDPTAAAQLSSVQQSLGQIGADQSAMQSRVSGLFSRLGALGIRLPGSGMSGYHAPPNGLGILPAIPIVLIATGGAVALGIVAIFSNYQKQAQIVEAVERGTLSADEARTIGAGKPLFGLDLGKLAFPLMLVGGLIVAAPYIKRSASLSRRIGR